MNTERPRILLVDDDVDICQLLPALLKSEGGDYHITTSQSFHSAKLLLGTLRFDLFITEYFIPHDQTVAKFCHSIKLVSPNSPFIVYSKFDEKMAKEDAMGAGADVYLAKSDDMENVCSSVRELLRRNAETEHSPEGVAIKRSSTGIV